MVIDESDKHFMYVYKWEEGKEGMLVAKSPVCTSSSVYFSKMRML